MCHRDRKALESGILQIFLEFRVMSEAAGSRPKRTLVAVSHAHTALTTTVFDSSAINCRMDFGNEGFSVIHQISACVSSKRCNRNYSQPSISSGGRGKKNSGPTLIFPFQAPGFRCPRLSSIATNRTTGFFPRAITISSPRQARSISRESSVLAL